MARLFEELKRRNVIRAAITYVVAAWVLLQVVDLLAPALHLPEAATRVTLYALLIGFPIAILLSWFYEITPDGISPDEDSDSESPQSKTLDQRLNLTVMALLAAAVILFAIDKWWPDDVTDPSVAVLPFVNMSGLQENEYFADGLTATVLHDLAQNPNLRVSAATSIFEFKDKNSDVREIASILGVANILEGSVQRVGDELRITAQLIRASDGTHLWSAKYDRQLQDVFDIQDEIAASVGVRLMRSLLKTTASDLPVGISTDSTASYDLYLHALESYRVSTFESLRRAEDVLKSVLTSEPSFTEAKLLLAETYVALADTNAMDSQIGLETAAALFAQVLAEQPGNIDAQAFLVVYENYLAMMAGDPSKRVDTIEQLYELVATAPNNVGVRLKLARELTRNNMIDEAIEQYTSALNLDPLNTFALEVFADMHSDLRNWNQAVELFRRSFEIDPRQSNIAAQLAGVSKLTGNAVDFVRYMEKASELDPLDHEFPADIAAFLYELDLIDHGDRFAERTTAMAPSSPAALQLQIIRAIRTGDKQHSLAVARQMIRDDVDDRRNAWLRSFHHLLLTAVADKKTEHEMEFVREHLPAFEDWRAPVPWKVGLARAQTLEIWHDLDSEQGIQDRLDSLEQVFASLNLPMARVEIVHIDYLLMRGDLEGAIDAALDGLYSHSVLEHLNIQDRYQNPLYREFNADPRIAEAQERWQQEWLQAREDVRGYLAEQEQEQTE